MDGNTHAAQVFMQEGHVVKVSMDVICLRYPFLHHPVA